VISELTDDYAVIHCGLQYVDYHTGRNLNQRISTGNINEIVRNNLGIIPQTSTMIIKKDVLVEIGLFDESLPAHQESELGLRIAQKYKFKLIDKILVRVTRNHNQIRSDLSSYIKAKEIILENHSDILSDKTKYNYCIIIAGDSIVNNDFLKAKRYFKNALKYKFKLKTILSYIMINLSPGLTQMIYRGRYKSKGLIK